MTVQYIKATISLQPAHECVPHSLCVSTSASPSLRIPQLHNHAQLLATSALPKAHLQPAGCHVGHVAKRLPQCFSESVVL